MVSLGVHRHYVPTDLQPNAVYHFRLRVHYRHVDPFDLLFRPHAYVYDDTL